MNQDNYHSKRIEQALHELESSVNTVSTNKPSVQSSTISLITRVKYVLYGVSFLSLTWIAGMIGLPAVIFKVNSVIPFIWPSVAIGLLFYSLIWMSLTGILTYGISRKKNWSLAIAKWSVIPLILFYALTFLTVNKLQFKKPDDAKAYHQLHPALRIGLNTLILIDSDLLITNLQRTKQDYINWGLTPLEQSDHYVHTTTGFVHATDIRTKGRAEWKNKLTQLSFSMMGFRTLRHVGTTDHLHISIPK